MKKTRQIIADFIPRLTESFDSRRRERQLRILFWLVAVALGLIEVWVFRYNIKDVDGISYLDMGDAYLRGDWMTAINGLWSPLYAWILGLSMVLLKPTPYQEYSVIELVNFLIYIAALACFDFFLRELIEYQRKQATSVADGQQAALPPWALMVSGYSLFIWSSLFWIFIWLQCPDMCVSAFVYLAGGIFSSHSQRSSKLVLFRRVGSYSRIRLSGQGFDLPARLHLSGGQHVFGREFSQNSISGTGRTNCVSNGSEPIGLRSFCRKGAIDV
jgi:hypothetical protein